MNQPKRRPVLDLSKVKGKVSVGSKRGARPPSHMRSRRPEHAGVKAKGRPGHTPGLMNSLEAQYAEFLAGEVVAGRVAEYHFESHRLLINDEPRSWWTPDFEVIYPDGRVEFIDTKGMKRPTEQLKIKIAAGRYRAYYFVIVTRVKGQWKREPIDVKREVIG